MTALLLTGLVSGQMDADIQPSNPEVIELNSSNNYEKYRTFDGSSSDGSITSYSWNLVGSTQSDTGPTANFTFSLDESDSNTIRLTTSNSTTSDVAEVTQNLEDVPRVDFTSDNIDIKTGETVKFTSDVNESFHDTLTYSWEVDGTEESTSSNFETSFDSEDDYDVKLTVNDGSDLSNSKEKTFSVTESSSDEEEPNNNQNNDNPSTFSQNDQLPDNAEADVGPDNPAEVFFSDKAAVSKVTIEVDSDVGTVEVNVDPESSKPSEVSEPGREVYKYMDITTNVSDNDISNAEVDFEVTKKWINSRNASNEDVRLLRYNSQWDELNTEVTDQNSTHVDYKADIPGFSTFAVSTKEVQQVETQDDQNSNQDTNQDTNENNQNTTDTQESNKEQSTFSELPFNPLLALPIVLFALALFAAYHFRGKIRRFYYEKKLSRKLDSLENKIKNKEELGESYKTRELYEEFEKNYENGKYLKAYDVLEKLDSKIS